RFERHQSVGSGPFRAPTRASQRMTVFCYAARVRLSFERFGEFAELTGRDVRTESRLNALEIKGGDTLSRRILRNVISTMSARVWRSRILMIAVRTSSISMRRPQWSSSGKVQREYAVWLTHGIRASGPLINLMTEPNLMLFIGRARG